MPIYWSARGKCGEQMTATLFTTGQASSNPRDSAAAKVRGLLCQSDSAILQRKRLEITRN